MNIFEQVTGNAAAKGEGETLIGPWWCEHTGCFDVEDEATYFKETGFVVWTCEEGHKNTVKEFSID